MSAVISMEAVMKSIECLPAEQKVAVLQALLLEAKPVAVVAKSEEPAQAGKKEEGKAKKEKSFRVYCLGLKRKAVEETSDAVCSSWRARMVSWRGRAALSSLQT